jgi:hypothetical protein
MPVGKIEQRGLLRAELPPPGTTIVVRGGRDTVDKLAGHAQRTARAWVLDGQPLLGISLFGVLGISLDDLLARRFASFRTIYLPTAGQLAQAGSSCWPPGDSRTSPSGSAAPPGRSWRSSWQR